MISKTLKFIICLSVVALAQQGVCYNYSHSLNQEGIILEIAQPKCFGEEGKIRVQNANNIGVLCYSFDGQHFYTYQEELLLGAGLYQFTVQEDLETNHFNFSIMPDEEISFDFINIEQANCAGRGGRIQAAVTGSGTAQLPNTGSGTILFNSTAFGSEIDITVDAGSYTITAFLNDNVQVDTTVFVTQETCEVYVPNVIYPESNQVRNQQFILGFPPDTNPIIQTYSIYDRWGSLVYNRSNVEGNQFTEWWDGTCNGDPCLKGVYAYKVVVSFDSGDVVERAGSISLLF